MATILGSILEADPAFVAGTFDAKDVRLAAVGNVLPGLFASGDFAISQRAAGANMSVDVAQGRAFIDPGLATHQGVYLTRRTNGTAYNSSVDAGITVTAADPTNPRIDLWCLAIADTVEDAGGSTGSRLVLVTGTASAAATHQLEVGSWPAVPAGYMPIAAVRVPAAATTLTTANITNLNPAGGVGRVFPQSIATVETTTSATYTRLATPDFVFFYLPSALSHARLYTEGIWKISVASGTQGMAFFIDGVQAKVRNTTNGAPSAIDYTLASLGTFTSRYATSPNGASAGIASVAGATADVSDVSTGVIGWNLGTTACGDIPVSQMAAGWHLIEVRYKTSANTLTVQNRKMRVEVLG